MVGRVLLKGGLWVLGRTCGVIIPSLAWAGSILLCSPGALKGKSSSDQHPGAIIDLGIASGIS